MFQQMIVISLVCTLFATLITLPTKPLTRQKKIVESALRGFIWLDNLQR